MNKSLQALAALSVTVLMLAGWPTHAEAGGLFLTDRGGRPLSRGFAFVAGADDPQSIWYNPAGLTRSGQQFLFDTTITLFEGQYTRVDSGGVTQQPVDAGVAPIPIPMVAYSHPLSDDFTIGAGVYAPNAGLLNWPRGLTADGQRCEYTNGQDGCGPAPQRYSLYSLEGSLFVNATLALGWQVSEHFSLGVGAHVMVGAFAAEAALSSCDGFVCSQPEDPNEDGVVRFGISPIIQPGVSLGANYESDIVTIGASVMWWPGAISGTAQLDVRLPSGAIFDNATVEGNQAEVELSFPIILRAGVEVRPIDGLRVEAAIVYEGWSSQDAVTIEPTDVWIRNATAIGDYQVGTIVIPREMRDVFSVRLGGSYALLNGGLILSAGLNYENSSFDDEYLTAMTLDSDKLITALGAAIEVDEGVFIDLSYGHIFLQNRTVTNSQVFQPNPIRPPRAMGVDPSAGGAVPIGNGTYVMEADIFGVGLRWRFDDPSVEPVEDEEDGEEDVGDPPDPRTHDESDDDNTDDHSANSEDSSSDSVDSADDDGDGVDNAHDQCPESPAGASVDWLGC